MSTTVTRTDWVRMRIRSLVSSGRPVVPGDEIYLPTPGGRREGYDLVTADGHSMDTGGEHSIRHGDVLLVDTYDLELIPGKVYVVDTPSEGECVKRVRRIHGELWLTSDNIDYADFRLEDATVVGRVVRVIRLFDY